MPTSYLDSSDPPDIEIRGWLGWSQEQLLGMTGDTYIAALLGIARSGDVQMIYKPIVVKNESGEPIAIVGNASHDKSEPSQLRLYRSVLDWELLSHREDGIDPSGD